MSKNLNKKFVGFILIIIILQFLYYSSISLTLVADSNTYLFFDVKGLFNGSLGMRTPVYPLLIQTMNYFFGENGLQFVVYFQIILSFFAVIILHRIFRSINDSENFAYILSLLYASSPIVLNWNKVIMTESIALSLTIVWIYLILCILNDKHIIYSLLSILLNLMMIFLRPTFLFFFIILIVIILYKAFEKKRFKKMLISLIAYGLSIICLHCYSVQFQKQFGIYSLTSTMPSQQLYNIMINSDLYKHSNDENFIKVVDKSFETDAGGWLSTAAVLRQYSLNDISRISNEVIKSNFSSYLNDYYFVQASNVLLQDFDIYSNQTLSNNNSVSFIQKIYLSLLKSNSFSNPSIAFVGLITLLAGLNFIYEYFVRKKFKIYIFLLVTINCGIFFSTIYGTCAEYNRTMIHIIPVTFVIIYILCSDFLKGDNDCRFFDNHVTVK